MSNTPVKFLAAGIAAATLCGCLEQAGVNDRSNASPPAEALQAEPAKNTFAGEVIGQMQEDRRNIDVILRKINQRANRKPASDGATRTKD